MSELKIGWRVLPVIVILFVIIGAAIGLWIGAVGLPVQIANVDATDLKPSAQDEMIGLIADTYAYDQDLDHAKSRLAELKDKNISARVAALAKENAAQNQASAADLAALAIALGARDEQIALIVTTLTPTITPSPMPTETLPPSLTPPATPTWTPTATITPTRTPTRRPTVTPTPKPAPIPPTNWIPAFPNEWPPDAKYEPVNVAPGQKYWHLAKAIYCDQDDEHDYCQNMPGGGEGVGTYIMFIGGGAPISVTGKDGKSLNLEAKAAGDMCNCTYSFPSNGFTVQVAGAPSDKISGLALYSVKAKLSNWHVRYFLWFQQVTR